MKPIVRYINLGRIDYKTAWDIQTEYHQELIRKKRAAREEGISDFQQPIHYLICCEHPPVYTLGKSGKLDHLKIDIDHPDNEEFEFHKINRGGDITYHGPGQLVVYPIFDLDCFFTDVHRYVRSLEEVVIRTLRNYNIVGVPKEGFTGVWVERKDSKPQWAKLCAIGVHLSRWVTLHGLALNVNTNLAHFGNIIPCGIQDDNKTITSVKNEIGRNVDFERIKQEIADCFSEIFDFELEKETNERRYPTT